jgi:hypothetical protein
VEEVSCCCLEETWGLLRGKGADHQPQQAAVQVALPLLGLPLWLLLVLLLLLLLPLSWVPPLLLMGCGR